MVLGDGVVNGAAAVVVVGFAVVVDLAVVAAVAAEHDCWYQHCYCYVLSSWS